MIAKTTTMTHDKAVQVFVDVVDVVVADVVVLTLSHRHIPISHHNGMLGDSLAFFFLFFFCLSDLLSSHFFFLLLPP